MEEITKFKSLENKLIKYKGQFVLIDSDVAKLYGVTTKEINQAVANNIDKFPDGYIIELTKKEKIEVVKNFDHLEKLKYSPYLPKVFTEKGLYMLATILKSDIATKTTIQIIETFAKMKEFALNYNDIVVELCEFKQDIKTQLDNTQKETEENTEHIKKAFKFLSQILEDTKKVDEKTIGFIR